MTVSSPCFNFDIFRDIFSLRYGRYDPHGPGTPVPFTMEVVTLFEIGFLPTIILFF